MAAMATAALLRRDGWHVNPNRVIRIWRREGLKVPIKQPRRARLWLNDGSCIRLQAVRPNHVWSYDFVADRNHDGRSLRMLTVIDAAIAFLQMVDPAFRVRHGAVDDTGYRWAHVGNDCTYITLQAPHRNSESNDEHRPYKDYGVNHLAFVVDDFASVAARLEDHGFRRGIPTKGPPSRKRAYYFDAGGLEWEIVEYTTDVMAQHNAYEE